MHPDIVCVSSIVDIAINHYFHCLYDMTISKELRRTTLSIEVQSGIDKDGNPSYKKKNFLGIKGDSTPEALVNEISSLEAKA